MLSPGYSGRFYNNWGNTISIQDGNGQEITSLNDIGNLNPFRYRGYYFDSDTGLYYLQNRYYDPKTCRFINADTTDILAAKGDLYDKNLFAYCDNNPVARVDDGGDIWNWLVGAAVSVASVYIGDVVNNIANGKSGLDILAPTSYLGDYLGAAVSGMIPGAGIWSAVGRVVVSTTVKNVTNLVVHNESITIENIKNDVIDGAVGEVINFGTNKGLDKLRPKNYSTFRHQVTQRKPQISPQRTREMMQSINRLITRSENVLSFSLGLVWSVYDQVKDG